MEEEDQDQSRYAPASAIAPENLTHATTTESELRKRIFDKAWDVYYDEDSIYFGFMAAAKEALIIAQERIRTVAAVCSDDEIDDMINELLGGSVTVSRDAKPSDATRRSEAQKANSQIDSEASR
jgi:hypothetical protein